MSKDENKSIVEKIYGTCPNQKNDNKPAYYKNNFTKIENENNPLASENDCNHESGFPKLIIKNPFMGKYGTLEIYVAKCKNCPAFYIIVQDKVDDQTCLAWEQSPWIDSLEQQFETVPDKP